jgi:IclR family transcriptional regulator, KDG regulon repressor
MADRSVPAGQLGTVGSALEVLLALKDKPMTISELIAATGVERSGAYRILRTLAAQGFVARSANGTYRLGIALWELGVAARRQLPVREMTSTAIQNLAQSLGETVVMTVYDHGYAVYVDLAEGTEPVRSYVQLGMRAPAHCVASGKALLAYQNAEEVARVGAQLETFTAHTIRTPEELDRHLSEIRQSGLAINNGEWREEVGGYAVPVLDLDGNAAFAFGFTGPIERLNRRADELIAALRTTQESLVAGLRGSQIA